MQACSVVKFYPAPPNYSVVLTDDHEVVRFALRRLLEENGFHVVGEASDYETTIELVERLKPNLLLLDIGLPGRSGVESIAKVLILSPNTKVAMLTMYEDPVKVQQSLQSGAHGYILKNSDPQTFVEALQTVISGQRYIPKCFKGLIFGDAVNSLELVVSGAGDPLAKLSKREREVFFLLADGHPNRVIAKQLFISPRTVETHRARVIKKLGFSSTADLVRYAIRHSLLSA